MDKGRITRALRHLTSLYAWEATLVSSRTLGKHIPDPLYLRMKYRVSTGKRLDLKNPVTFNEKLQWLKLHDRDPRYTSMVDKAAVKGYVAGLIGERYIIPTLGVWERFDDIDFDTLPERFILKCTHDSGSAVICTDKASFDRASAKQKLEACLGRNYYDIGREWPYKNVHGRIIAEQFLCPEDGGDLRDYKFFCFDGRPEFFKVDFDRQTGHKTNYYYADGTLMPFAEEKYPPAPERTSALPENLSLMLDLASKLSAGIPFVRVDFYEVNHSVFFGELTFFHHSGFVRYIPEEWDGKLGEYIKLPGKTDIR